VREALVGNGREARRRALLAQGLSTGRDVEDGAALAMALSGVDANAQRLADDLEGRFPQDTAVRFSYVPTIRALIALNHREMPKAIELLQTASPYELGWHGCCTVGFNPSLYTIYVRGLAYLAAHQGAEAAAEFQKILDHRGIVINDPIGVLARLQLGRALALMGDRAKAKTAYEGFLTRWENADSEIPVFKQAKAEYGNLQ
jgi:tetratricopeptide (TPR) repeat protein